MSLQDAHLFGVSFVLIFKCLGIFLVIDFDFTRNPANQTVVNGSRTEQICDPPNHFPKNLQFKWYKDYRTLRTGGRDTILPSGNLVISPVLKEDEGVYFCAVWNDFKETRSSTVAHLTVNGMF